MNITIICIACLCVCLVAIVNYCIGYYLGKQAGEISAKRQELEKLLRSKSDAAKRLILPE